MSVSPLIFQGDLALENGSFLMIDGKTKLIQDLTQIILLPTGEDIFHPEFGCDVTMKIGYPMAQNATAINIKNAVIKALSYYSQIQTAQEAYQSVLPAEKLLDIGIQKVWQEDLTEDLVTVDAIEVSVEPGIVKLKVYITTAEYEEVILPFNVYMVPTQSITSGLALFHFTKWDTGSGIWSTDYVYKP